VIGFRGANVLSMPVETTEGIRVGDAVLALEVRPEIEVPLLELPPTPTASERARRACNRGSGHKSGHYRANRPRFGLHHGALGNGRESLAAYTTALNVAITAAGITGNTTTSNAAGKLTVVGTGISTTGSVIQDPIA
jgi:hypothetical protein